MSVRLCLIAGLFALPLGGCVAAAVGTAGAVSVAAVQERTVGEAVDDATTSNEIKASLLSEGGLGEVDVEVSSGLVLLSGRVASPEQRTRAENIAWGVERTLDVANEIKIQRPGGILENIQDEVTTARVRRALLGSSSVRSYNFNIETYDGVVYLMGIARTHEEMVAAAEEASFVGGVKQVVSYIRVRDPRPLAAQSAVPPVQQGAVGTYESESDQAADSDLLGGTY